MPRIETKALTLELDERGRLTSLKNRETGREYVGGGPVWRLFYEYEERLQNEIVASDAVASVETEGDRIRLVYDHLPSVDGDLDIRLVIEAAVDGDETRWSAAIENGADGVLLKELQFPLAGPCGIGDDYALITNASSGLRHRDPRAFIRAGRRPPYCDEDYNGIQKQAIYPGPHAASNCYVFAGEAEGIYFGCHQDGFPSTVHLWRILGEDIESGFCRYLFMKTGESARLTDFVISPYSGTWHVAGDKYRAWKDTWWSPPARPAWVDAMNGWQRIVLKHQDGKILHPYDKLPEIFDDGAKAGVKTLFMFGWWPGGMDRMYPEYVPDPKMGGEAALKENIRRFQEEKGGNVILYASGRLVDLKSDFWLSGAGRRSVIKHASGEPVRDNYLFGNRCCWPRMYGAVELAPMCIGAREWVEVLKGVIDKAHAYGCKGVFFDQLGASEHPCSDPDHGHPTPFLHPAETKRAVLTELVEYARSLDPEMGVGIELFTDAFAERTDFLHSVLFGSRNPENADWMETGEKPRQTCFVDWTKFVYPDQVLSDRDIRDDYDIERRVNHTLMTGMIHDVEIYRCRETIAEVPRYQAWLGEVNALRARHADLLQFGTYRDTLGFEHDNGEIDGKAFVQEDRMAVLLTQSHLERAETAVTVPGYRITGNDGVGAVEVRIEDGRATVVLGRHGLGALLCEKEKG